MDTAFILLVGRDYLAHHTDMEGRVPYTLQNCRLGLKFRWLYNFPSLLLSYTYTYAKECLAGPP